MKTYKYTYYTYAGAVKLYEGSSKAKAVEAAHRAEYQLIPNVRIDRLTITGYR